MKTFHIRENVGRAKYLVNYHDGKKKHADGSDFFDISIFKNKKNLARFIGELQSQGYSESPFNWS